MAKKAKAQRGSPQQPKITFSNHDLNAIQPKTENQRILFVEYGENPDSSFFMYGSPGTGKTFLSLYLGLTDILSEETPQTKMIIVRSTVPSRDIGFLPGTKDEKAAQYEAPYGPIFDQLFPFTQGYENMKKKGMIEFMPTAFLRGQTFDNTVIVVDECQNMTYQELTTIISRVGRHSKILFCGDIQQNDLVRSRNDVSGFSDFFNIIASMSEFKSVKFTAADIVRSGLVKSFILAEERYKNKGVHPK